MASSEVMFSFINFSSFSFLGFLLNGIYIYSFDLQFHCLYLKILNRSASVILRVLNR